MSLLWLKRGWLTPGSQTLRTLERFGASDVWDFVDNSYLRAGVVTTNAGLTVTRASTGYAETSDGRLVEFGSGVLRRTDKGVLVEGARTNLLLRSQEFDTFWIATAGAVTANAIAAPDGTTTADTFVPNNTNTDHRIRQDQSISLSTTLTFSIYAKAAGYGVVWITMDGGSSYYWFDLNAATTGGPGGGSSTITAFPDGWYRLTYTKAIGAANANFIWVSPTTSSLTFSGDGVSGVALWGAQVEAAPFASSYIATAASTVTRAADEVTASLTGVAYPVSLFAEFVRNGDTNAAEGVFQVDASSRAQRANISFSSSDTLSVTARGGANDGDATVTGAISVGAITKGAGRIVVDDVQAARAGTLATADTTASVPTSAPDTVRFGDFGSTANYGFLYLRRAAVISTALTDAQLQAITS